MDFHIIDRVFGMEGGYVLDFTNRTFAEFFHEEFDVDIDDRRWAAQGGSKAKRLRYDLRCAARQTALDTLNALREYREATSVTADFPKLEDSLRDAYCTPINSTGDGLATGPVVLGPHPRFLLGWVNAGNAAGGQGWRLAHVQDEVPIGP